jgi:hypothetical protein
MYAGKVIFWFLQTRKIIGHEHFMNESISKEQMRKYFLLKIFKIYISEMSLLFKIYLSLYKPFVI